MARMRSGVRNMNKETQKTRFTRILQLTLYLHQHGGTAQELAQFNTCTERTVHKDIKIIRESGINVECVHHTYLIKEWPNLMKVDDIDDPRQQSFSNTIFRKWYKADSKGNTWYVVRADKKDPKGTRIGEVRLSGKSFYQLALIEANKRNEAIKQKRKQVIDGMLALGWSHDQINQFRNKALEDARKELENPHYTDGES